MPATAMENDMAELTAARLEALRAKMTETGADLVALGPSSHMQWLAGFHTHPDERLCLMLVGRQKEAFVMPALNANGARERTDIAFFTWSDDEGPAKALADALEAVEANGAKRIVVDETMRADFALTLLGALPGARPVFTEATIGALRMRKDSTEYKLLKMNAQIADRAEQKAAEVARPGMTEAELASIIRDHFASEGAAPEFWIVGGGPNGAFPHHETGDRPFEIGDAIVVDIGCRKHGYPSDITRMIVVGQKPEGYDEIHAIVEQAVEAALRTAKPGVKARDVDKAARDTIAAAGYGAYFTHRTGHGLGVDVHEQPYITATNDLVLDEGMVFSIEPGIYLPGRFGIRLEEIVILRKDGPEILSDMPRTVSIARV